MGEEVLGLETHARPHRRAGWAAASILLALVGCTTAPAPSSLSTNGTRYRNDVRTWVDLRDRNNVIQRWDYSCGTGALATLLQYYYGDEVTEEQLLDDIFSHLSDEEAKDRILEGMLMSDLQHAAQRRGYEAQIGGLTIDKLPQLHKPIIVWVIRDGYKHFAVLRGIREDRVYLADPSAGNVRMSVHEFRQEYQERALILRKKGFTPAHDYPLVVDEDIPIRTELQGVRRSIYLDRR